MYVGHFMAWISASILFAFQLHQAGLTNEPAIAQAAEAGTLPAPLPGPLAYGAAGLAGLLCVIIAGWTTANPTIYRAGLAFQALSPKSSRFKVTLITGAVATFAGMFPAIAMKLLDFVAIYGMILMPMGAVIFVDFWVIPKLGLRSSYAELSGESFNPAAAVAWLLTLAICLGAVFSIGRWSLWFVSLPGWFVAAILYIVLSKFYQKKVRPEAEV
jgi:purine-cytosine permease-like protein